MLKSVLLAVTIALLAILGHPSWNEKTIASTPEPIVRCSPPSRSCARSLIQEGYELLDRGRAEEALERWQAAETAYTQLEYPEGIVGAQIDRSLALQALGQQRRACTTLLAALEMEGSAWLCEASGEGNLALQDRPSSAIEVVGLRNLGDVLRAIGKLEESEKVLEKSWEIGQRLPSFPQKDAVLLSLGNTARSRYNQMEDVYRRSRSPHDRLGMESHATLSLDYYQQAIDLSTSVLIPLQAKLNQLSLLLGLVSKPDREILETKKYWNKIQSLAAELEQIEWENLPLNQGTIYAQIDFARTLITLQTTIQTEFRPLEIDRIEPIVPDMEAIDRILVSATDRAVRLDDGRSRAYALGIRGRLYEQWQQFDRSQALTQQAIALAQSLQAWEISYQWQWQLGRIHRAKGEFDKAIAAYDVSVRELERVRYDLLSIDSALQFSFRETIEPLYREFLQLLLRPKASEQELERAIRVLESLKLAELENFLKCDLSGFVSIDEVESPPAAIIYPIVLDDRIDILVQLPALKKLDRYPSPLSREAVEEAKYNLQGRLSEKPDRDRVVEQIDREILPPARQLYDSLIRPIESDLPESGTLIFVLDSPLQGIPLAVLHDGSQYLIEKYSLAVSLGSQLPNPKPLPPGQWKALLAGVSEKSASFPTDLPALPNVRDELRQISAAVPSRQLLNEEFTRDAFEQSINRDSFLAIHLATHGQFSSDPQQIWINSWDGKIGLPEMEQLLRNRSNTNRNPIELLVLSACDTAKGDRQAVLGMAGVALRTNARSTVASLWPVSDGSTASFMGQFYQQLDRPNTTKARSLQAVQLEFLHNRDRADYQHPYYWAAFILAGNWL